RGWPPSKQIRNMASGTIRFKLAPRPRARGSNLRQSLAQPHARGRQPLPVLLKDVALEEIPSERQALADFAFGRHGLGEEETRQREQLIAISLAGRERDRAPALGRDESEIVVGAGGGAALEIEAEAERCEQRELEADIGRRPIGRGQRRDQRREALEH